MNRSLRLVFTIALVLGVVGVALATDCECPVNGHVVNLNPGGCQSHLFGANTCQNDEAVDGACNASDGAPYGYATCYVITSKLSHPVIAYNYSTADQKPCSDTDPCVRDTNPVSPDPTVKDPTTRDSCGQPCP